MNTNYKIKSPRERGVDIYIFRHGESDYLQTFPSIQNADDLKKAGIKTIRQSAKELITLLKPINGEVIQIYSSPHGRTLHTSKIILEALTKGKIAVKEIKIKNDLGDQKGYNYQLVSALVNGGNVTYKGIKFYVDKSITNPYEINEKNYGAREIGNISGGYLKTLPKAYSNEIEKIEKTTMIRKRTFKAIDSILKNPKGGIYILVTHNANTNFLIEKLFSLTGQKLLKPGEFFSISKKGENIQIIFKKQTKSVNYPQGFRKIFL